LDHPAVLDVLAITLSGCTAADISQIIGPYLHHTIRRVSERVGTFPFLWGSIISCVGEAGGMEAGFRNMNKLVSFTVFPGIS
jgi:hypothetical protein